MTEPEAETWCGVAEQQRPGMSEAKPWRSAVGAGAAWLKEATSRLGGARCSADAGAEALDGGAEPRGEGEDKLGVEGVVAAGVDDGEARTRRSGDVGRCDDLRCAPSVEHRRCCGARRSEQRKRRRWHALGSTKKAARWEGGRGRCRRLIGALLGLLAAPLILDVRAKVGVRGTDPTGAVGRSVGAAASRVRSPGGGGSGSSWRAVRVSGGLRGPARACGGWLGARWAAAC